MATGFISQQSDRSLPGAATFGILAGWIVANKFTAPGSGILDISEIGVNGDDSGSGSAPIRLGIYTDNSDALGSLVANSDGGEIDVNASPQWWPKTVSSCQVTAGSAYWLCIFASDGDFDVEGYLASTTGPQDWHRYTGLTYPNWPTNPTVNLTKQWDMPIYAVYSQAGADAIIPKILKPFVGFQPIRQMEV